MAQKYPAGVPRYSVWGALPKDSRHPRSIVVHFAGPDLGQEGVAVPLTLGEAYELGRELVEGAEALLAGVGRPWDDDPGRAPYFSRPRARQGTGEGRGGRARSAGPAAAAERRDGAASSARTPRSDGYPRPRRSVRGGEQGSAP